MRQYSQVEHLSPEHRLDEFDCGSPSLTDWLRRRALVAEQAGTCRVYVVRRTADDRVVGYCALAIGAVVPESATPRFLKGTGNYPVPVVLLTRLGVDVSEQGRGLGRALVVDAFRRVVEAADIVGVRGLLIHAEDSAARNFYLRLASFEQSPTDPLHLLLLMKDLRKAMP